MPEPELDEVEEASIRAAVAATEIIHPLQVRVAELESRLARWRATVRAAVEWWTLDQDHDPEVSIMLASKKLDELGTALEALSEQERSEIMEEDHD